MNVDQHEWDNLVASLGGGYFHCFAHNMHSAARSNAKPLFVKALDEQGSCIAIATCVINTSRIWPLSRYCKRASFSTMPVAKNNDPDVEQSLMSVLEKHLRQMGVYYIDVASYDSINSERILGPLEYDMFNRNEYYFDLTKSFDELWNAANKSKRRQKGKAERAGVETKIENTLEAMELVHTFHALSMQRRNISVSPWKDHKIGADLLASGRINIMVSYHDGEPVNAEILSTFNQKVYGQVSGSSEKGNKVCGPTHLTWAAIKIFKEKGASVLSLGGAKEAETGLACYKSEFGAISVSMPYGRKIISKFGANLIRLRSLGR